MSSKLVFFASAQNLNFSAFDHKLKFEDIAMTKLAYIYAEDLVIVSRVHNGCISIFKYIEKKSD